MGDYGRIVDDALKGMLFGGIVIGMILFGALWGLWKLAQHISIGWTP